MRASALHLKQAFDEVFGMDTARSVDEYATAIGRVCIAMAYLEDLIDMLLTEMAGISDCDVADIITAHSDLNQKIMMMKGVGFKLKPSTDWFNRLRDELNSIASLQERRNRVVHDLWSPLDDGLHMRIRRRVVFRRPQSRQPEQMTLIERTPVKVEEIWNLVSELENKTVALMRLQQEWMGVKPTRPAK